MCWFLYFIARMGNGMKTYFLSKYFIGMPLQFHTETYSPRRQVWYTQYKSMKKISYKLFIFTIIFPMHVYCSFITIFVNKVLLVNFKNYF